MKTILLTTVIASGSILAYADDVATTNAPNFTLTGTNEVATNSPPDSMVENRNAPPTVAANSNRNYSTNYSTTHADPAWRSSSDRPQGAYDDRGPYVDHHDYLDRRFEVGAIFGEPTGASLKYWFNDRLAIDGVLGWAFHQDDIDFYVHSDVLYHFPEMFHVSRGELLPYVGVGLSAKFRDDRDDIWGIRVPIGVEYLFDNCPVSVFGEVAPVLDVAPGARGDFSVGIGARYRF